MLVALAAALVAGCAAYYSVFGLGQLFAGASIAVIIMASSLEFSKVVAVSFLQRYWNQISKSLRTYLLVGVFVLVCITSAGIYGFLSNAYQKTASQLEISEGKLSILDNKKTLFEKNITDNNTIITTKTTRVSQLSELRTNQETRLDAAATSGERTRARNDIASATKEIQKLNGEIDTLNAKNSGLLDSVNYYATKSIETSASSNVAGEVGPLKYIAQLTGYPMDKVVNVFILLLIFVFDPLAVALVIATNRLMEIEKNSGLLRGTYKIVEGKIPVEVDRNSAEAIAKLEHARKAYFGEDSEESELDWNKRAITAIEKSNKLIEESHGLEFEPNPEALQEKLEHAMKVGSGKVVTTPIEPLIEPILTSKVEPVVESVPEAAIAVQKPKREPVIPTGSVKREEIREIKDANRGFSKDIPQPTKNTIERIGTNKFVNRDNDGKIFFKRNKDG